MNRAVILDSSPLSLLSAPLLRRDARRCARWVSMLMRSGVEFFIPDIVDYELRRELLRAGKHESVQRLDELRSRLEVLPVTFDVLLRAAELCAHARQTGQPTAAKQRIDTDMILVAQAESCPIRPATIATTNVGHLARFFPAAEWTAIA